MSGIYKVSALRTAGLAADWTAENVVLAAGAIGVETDSGKSKIGDGATAWTSLAYVGASSGAPAVTSVAGRTGAVVLTASDVSGVATPASVATAIAAIPATPAATKTAAGVVKMLPLMAQQTFATVADAQTAFNNLLTALIAAGMMSAS